MEELEDLGTLEQYKVVGGTTQMNPNFRKRNKQLVLSFLDKKGKQITMFNKYESITVSKAVSDDLRDDKLTLGQVLTFPVLINPKTDVPYVSYPGSPRVAIANDKYDIAEFEMEDVDIEDFISL